MNKILSFCKSNKPFVAVAIAFVLLGSIFNKDLNRLSNQFGLVITINPTSGATGTIASATAFQTYPSLSDSGFYLETKIGTAGYTVAIAGVKASMDGISTDIKNMFVYYYKNGCATSVTSVCSDKATSILNALYTYSSYSTEYYKLSYESSHGSTPITTDIDWAGIAGSSVTEVLKYNLSQTSDSFLTQLTLKTLAKTRTAIAAGSFTYTQPALADTLTSLKALLKTKAAVFSIK